LIHRFRLKEHGLIKPDELRLGVSALNYLAKQQVSRS
jgi:hypothetical protein